MSKDHWSVAEYRQYMETGRMPAEEKLPEIFPGTGKEADSYQAQIEAAWEKAESEGRVMVLDLGPADRPSKRKYGNEKIREDGIVFDSRHEHNVYRWLKARRERGELRWVFVHVPFRFSSGVVYWADFVTVLADGRIEAVWDAKSEITARNKDYVIKKKLLLNEWGIEVREVMRTDADGKGGYFSRKWPIMP